jgi:hypothetical protein
LLANQALLGEQFHQRIEGQHVRVGQFLEADGLAVAFGCHVRPPVGRCGVKNH